MPPLAPIPPATRHELEALLRSRVSLVVETRDEPTGGGVAFEPRQTAHAGGTAGGANHVMSEIRATRPLSIVMAERIAKLRA